MGKKGPLHTQPSTEQGSAIPPCPSLCLAEVPKQVVFRVCLATTGMDA